MEPNRERHNVLFLYERLVVELQIGNYGQRLLLVKTDARNRNGESGRGSDRGEAAGHGV